MNLPIRFYYALTRQPIENRICCQNFYAKANEKIMLAMEDANTWEEMEVSLTHSNVSLEPRLESIMM